MCAFQKTVQILSAPMALQHYAVVVLGEAVVHHGSVLVPMALLKLLDAARVGFFEAAGHKWQAARLEPGFGTVSKVGCYARSAMGRINLSVPSPGNPLEGWLVQALALKQLL
jgi:hypothetical protein